MAGDAEQKPMNSNPVEDRETWLLSKSPPFVIDAVAREKVFSCLARLR